MWHQTPKSQTNGFGTQHLSRPEQLLHPPGELQGSAWIFKNNFQKPKPAGFTQLLSFAEHHTDLLNPEPRGMNLH